MAWVDVTARRKEDERRDYIACNASFNASSHAYVPTSYLYPHSRYQCIYRINVQSRSWEDDKMAEYRGDDGGDTTTTIDWTIDCAPSKRYLGVSLNRVAPLRTRQLLGNAPHAALLLHIVFAPGSSLIGSILNRPRRRSSSSSLSPNSSGLILMEFINPLLILLLRFLIEVTSVIAVIARLIITVTSVIIKQSKHDVRKVQTVGL